MQEILSKILHCLDASTDIHYSVHFVSPDEIRELNKLHRGIDKVTDVLSFPLLDLESGTQRVFYNANDELEIDFKTKRGFKKIDARDFKTDINPDTGQLEIGDIVINELEPNPEFLKLHGLLHLLGFHHKD
jgi:probable rRNA maturation factor